MNFFGRLLHGMLHDDRLDTILERLNKMASTLDQITADVAAEGTVVQSAIVLINGLKAQLDAAGTDPAKLNELSTQLRSQSAALAAAVAANTNTAPVVVTPTTDTTANTVVTPPSDAPQS